MAKLAQRRGRNAAWLSALYTALTPLAAQSPEAGRSIAAPLARREADVLARELGDASYEKRLFATRRLLAHGRDSMDALQRTVSGTDAEAALRARQIVTAMDQLWFLGSEVTLSTGSPGTRWNDPLDLTLTIRNGSSYPSRIPFELSSDHRGSWSADARQMADVIDLSEWLVVRRPNGTTVDLRMDDLSGDPEILSVVQSRVDDSPITIVAPGESVSLTVPGINRGAARFPLLDSGDYSFVVEYVPHWSDEALEAAGVGRVRSNTATVTVSEGAPAAVSRSAAEAELNLHRDGSALVARLTNTRDLTVRLNLNFGPAPPFADARWLVDRGAKREEIPVINHPVDWKDFDPENLVELHAGESAEIARISWESLLIPTGIDGTPQREETMVSLTYSNLCDRLWQRRQGDTLLGNPDAPASLRSLLPRRILSTRQTTAPLVLDAREDRPRPAIPSKSASPNR